MGLLRSVVRVREHKVRIQREIEIEDSRRCIYVKDIEEVNHAVL